MLQCRNAKPSVPEGQACSANQFHTKYNTQQAGCGNVCQKRERQGNAWQNAVSIVLE